MRAAPISSQGSEFQQFLYAPICEEAWLRLLSIGDFFIFIFA
jgi:hypothetical protein